MAGPEGTLEFKFTGLDDLDRALDELSSELKSDILATALSRAAKPFLVRASQLAPRGTEPKPEKKRLANSMRTSRRMSRTQRLVLESAGAARVLAGSSSPHAHLVEFGHAIVVGRRPTSRILRRRDTRERVGFVKARPFLRPAWDTTRDVVMASIKDEIGAALQRRIKQLARRAQRGALTVKDVRQVLGD